MSEFDAARVQDICVVAFEQEKSVAAGHVQR